MNKILSSKTPNAIFFIIVLFAGTFAAISPSLIVGAQAESYYGMDDRYDSYEPEYPSDNSYKSKDSSNTIIKKVKCNNFNVNLNGLELNVLPPTLANVLAQDDEGEIGAGSYGIYEDGQSSYDKKNFKFVCINNNNNTVIEAAEEPLVPPTPPTPPTPTTASLTVNKEIYGCDNVFPLPPPPLPLGTLIMDCRLLLDNDDRWIQCDESPISDTSFCRALPENIFDIRVLDDQNNQITEPFEGSPTGTTIENLEPGTYTVEEIKHTNAENQLGENPGPATVCRNAGFADGGQVNIRNVEQIQYTICFEYEDEQGNDCSTITLAAGESRTCTVKNYINFGRQDFRQ